MNPAARAAFVPFLLSAGEGDVDWLYMDARGVVTTGIGNALFSVEEAASLQWTGDVHAAWATVTSRRDLAGRGAGAFRDLTTARVSAASIDALIDRDLARYESELRPVFPGYDSAPATAQEGLLRLAYATGAANFAARWPNFTAAFNRRDWAACAASCRIPELDREGEPKANDLEAALFEQAAAAAPVDVTDGGTDVPVPPPVDLT